MPRLTGAQDDDEKIPWGRYKAALFRYKWVVLASLLLGVGVGTLLARFVNPTYEASARIWITDSRASNTATRGPIRSAEILNEQAWAELVKSYAVLDSVVDRMRLYLSPADPADAELFREFRVVGDVLPGSYELRTDATRRRYSLVNKGDEAVVDSGLVGQPIGVPAGFSWSPDPAALLRKGTVEFFMASPRAAATSLQKRLEAKLPERSNFLTLTLTGSNPRRTAQTLNAITEQFVATAAELKRRNIVELRRVLEAQLATAERQLRETEQQFRSFRTSTITLPSDRGVDTPDPMVDSYFAQKSLYDGLRRDRQVLEQLLVQARNGQLGPASSVAIPPGVQGGDALRATLQQLATAEAELRAAQQFYTAEHKTVQDQQRKVNTLRTTEVPLRLRELVQHLRDRERDLASRVQGSSRELQAIPQRTVDAMRLRRELTIAENMYTTLQGRHDEARLAEASAIPDINVLDMAATPQFPASNTGPRLLAIAIAASLAVGIALAILLDRADRRFRYPEQATRELGLRILGAIPAIRHDDKRPQSVEEGAQVVEAFRSLRLSLISAHESEGPLLLTITSPGPGDGKSLVSSNLALSFAEAGYRTLLVDGDIRRGELHRVFGVDRRPGLVDHLSGRAATSEIVRPTETHPMLDIVPCGMRRHRGPELLASAEMSRLIANLRHDYGVVIVDSPPLSAGIDPYALASATGQVMIVLRTAVTDRKLAEAKLELLDQLPVRLVGSVLNDIKGESHYRYYSYASGYGVPDEEMEDDVAPRLGARVGELAGRG